MKLQTETTVSCEKHGHRGDMSDTSCTRSRNQKGERFARGQGVSVEAKWGGRGWRGSPC